jgi:hypothetical protein
MPLPGWESLDTVSSILSALRWTGLGLTALGTVTAAGIIVYTNQEKELKARTGTVILEPRDKYTEQQLTGVICTTDKGTSIPALHPTKLPVDGYSGTCRLLGYIPEPVEWKVEHDKETKVPVPMEQATGSVKLVTKGSDDGQPIGSPISKISVDGGPLVETVFGN